MPYYAVSNGRNKGIYNSWAECKQQVDGYSGAQFKKFDSSGEARSFVSNPSSGSYGSSRGSSSSGSYGGYFGSSKAKDTFQTDDSGYVPVYTDGACFNNGAPNARAGLGVYFDDNHPLNVSEPVSGRATNNAGEIQAATRAIEIARSNGADKVLVKTDSQFLMKSTDWIPGWKENGWNLASGGPVKNKTDFMALDKAMRDVDVKFEYVEAHQGIVGNERADELARKGAAKY